LGAKFCNNCAQELVGGPALEPPAVATAIEVVDEEPRRPVGGARQTAEMMKLLFHSLEKLRAEPAARALTLVAFLLNTEHKYQRAANVATEAITLNTKLVEGYRVRAVALLSLSKFPEALADCDKAFEMADSTTKGDIMYLRARINKAAGNRKDACQDALSALKWDPTHPTAAKLRDEVCG
jgi:tetratricopeptide (TPR) repeat protein